MLLIKLLFVSVALCCVGSERILAVFPFQVKSHFFVFQSVLVELSKRGHDVTVVSQFPRKEPLNGYTDIDVRHVGSLEILLNLTDFEENGLTLQTVIDEITDIMTSYEKVFNDRQFKNLLNSNVKFDLIISEIFASDMFVGLSHKFQAPLVEMISSVVVPWGTDRFAMPDNPSYIRTYFNTGAGSMSFYERTLNALVHFMSKNIYKYVITRNDEKMSKLYLGGDVPHVEDIMKNTSLLLLNTHYSIFGARPMPPNVVEVGGVHIKPANPVPQELEKFINESQHGVIVFSLGSITNVSSMSESTRKVFCNSLAKLKERVLWKWEVDEMPDKPDNVKLLKWIPQMDVLAHPNVKMFIGHGGLLSTMEAVYNGVPMIGIPLFADQYQNIASLVNAGSAILLDYSKINQDVLSDALNSILKNETYKTNARRLSYLFRDRPLSPMDTAIYWIEYVMRHKGAHHLRSAAVDLPWYQFLLLDVIGAILVVVVLIILFIIKTFKFVVRLICANKKQKVH